MSKEGVHEMAFAFDTQGAQAIVNDPFIDSDERGGSRWVFVPRAAAGHAGGGDRVLPESIR